MLTGWYPSHMAKARRALRENLSLVDVVVEIVDARIPKTSRIPDFEALLSGKASIVAMNKADLAEEAATSRWREYFGSRRHTLSCAINASSGEGVGSLVQMAHERAVSGFGTGKRLRPFRAMAVGIPNVGKSSLLNRLAGRKSARTGDRPGITRGKQWIKVTENLELLDLPGILWPQQAQSHEFMLLSATGAVPDDAYDIPTVAQFLAGYVREHRPGAMASRYGVDEDAESGVIIEGIARRRGFLASGGLPDLTKAALALCVDFRTGRLGRFTLEMPDGEPEE